MAFAKAKQNASNPAALLVGRDGKRHAFAVDLNQDAERIKAQAARVRLATSVVAAALGAAEIVSADDAVANRKAAMAKLRERRPDAAMRQAARRKSSRKGSPDELVVDDAANDDDVDAMRTPRAPLASAAAVGVMRDYDSKLQGVRGRYGAGGTHGGAPAMTSQTPPPRLAPIPDGGGSRVATKRAAKGGAIARAPRRTLFDDATAPLASSAMTPTPGPAMLPYLELFDAVSPETTSAIASGVTRRVSGGHAPATGGGSSQWHRVPGRNHTRRSETGCRPVYLPPMERHVCGGAIGASTRQMF